MSADGTDLVNGGDYFHRLLVNGASVTVVRDRIERKLNVTTSAQPCGEAWPGKWSIDFLAPRDVDLDFLRPDVLPPLEVAA